MPLSAHFLEYGRRVGQLRRRRRPAYAPTRNIASHDNHEKINSWVSFSVLYEYGAQLCGPKGCRSSAISCISYSEIQGYVKQCMRARVYKNVCQRCPH